jgi:phosphoribosylaminoimidazolecarboxamide formyltransferase/IMP cyclohydrolase
MVKIKRALISVSDKTGLDDFVKGLHGMGVEIISTGGTAKRIEELNIPVRKVSEHTGFPEILDGRVKTLHPKIHGGLLALRDNTEHMSCVKEHGIELIDMVVVNLYPFEKAVSKEGSSLSEAIENIDIGGPSMLRSAAKNYGAVVVICNPARYSDVLMQMQTNHGSVSDELRAELALEAFTRTSEYDKAISGYLNEKVSSGYQPSVGKNENKFPQNLRLEYQKVQDLRYGENPHQKAAFYLNNTCKGSSIARAKQLHGKELSFNNIVDLNAALEIVKDFKEPTVTIIKHNNPCGTASRDTLAKAYRLALDADSLSAFGSIVGLNRKVDLASAKEMMKADFIECVIAPGYDQDAINLLKTKKNMRILDVPSFAAKQDEEGLEYKGVLGGVLVQDRDIKDFDINNLKVVTKKRPTKAQMESLLFGWKVAKHVKSNAIVLSRGKVTVGVGAGQMSRVVSVEIAVKKAGKKAKGSCLAGDAFFPMADGVITAAKAGIKAIIQPGGSIRDAETIKAADKYGVAMVFTGFRHFKH